VATVIGCGKLVTLKTTGIANKRTKEDIKLLKLRILWHVGPFLGNDREICNYTTVFAK
jgi:hypothetical protein